MCHAIAGSRLGPQGTGLQKTGKNRVSNAPGEYLIPYRVLFLYNAAMDTLPQKYHDIDTAELVKRIAARKAELGDSLCILGHHYQTDEVIQFADFAGDSLKLSQIAAGQRDAKYIVFCGVHFMAESADILAGAEQIVCLPSLRAGCGMADMADEAGVAAAIEEVQQLAGGGGSSQKILPITYVNSTAAVKAVTGRAGGACCTSSNVRNVFEWALRPAAEGGGGGAKVFAIPDQHLGRNTAVAMGFTKPADCAMYDPALPNGGLTAADVQAATFILWKGFCYVHQIFKPEHVDAVRREHEGITVIVHPECPAEVVSRADLAGSTSQIITAIAEAPAGSKWAIGTEGNLVNRLANLHTDKTICLLSPTPARCVQMGMIDLPGLLWILDGLAAGQPVNRISVSADIAADAKIALQRMIDIKAVRDVTSTPDNN